jgi:3-oxoacyl-(acyl-carrier-protein) synthase
MGIVSSIGNSTQEVLASLREARSGIGFAERHAELGFRSQVQGAPQIDVESAVDRRAMRFHGGGTAWNHVAMDQAIRDAGLEQSEISSERTGMIMGSGGPSTRAIVEAADIARSKSPKRVGPFAVPKAMSSTASATLATWFKIKGVNYSISSACATSNHCIGNAYEIIQLGKQDVIFAGGCEELDWSLSVLFDAMGAMSSTFNENPSVASRAYDAKRDGFVIAGGAGVVVLEELEHAKARGARIYGELVGYGATSDGFRHGAAVGRGRRALHEDGARQCPRADRLHQPACHFDARSATRRRSRPSARCSARRQMPADRRHQVADRPLARRGRRAGGDLLAADDEQRLHLRKRPYRRDRPGAGRHAHCASTCGRREDRLRAIQFLRIRRHERYPGVPALRRLRAAPWMV